MPLPEQNELAWKGVSCPASKVDKRNTENQLTLASPGTLNSVHHNSLCRRARAHIHPDLGPYTEAKVVVGRHTCRLPPRARNIQPHLCFTQGRTPEQTYAPLCCPHRLLTFNVLIRKKRQTVLLVKLVWHDPVLLYNMVCADLIGALLCGWPAESGDCRGSRTALALSVARLFPSGCEARKYAYGLLMSCILCCVASIILGPATCPPRVDPWHQLRFKDCIKVHNTNTPVVTLCAMIS